MEEPSPCTATTKARVLQSLCSATGEAAAMSPSTAMDSSPGSWQLEKACAATKTAQSKIKINKRKKKRKKLQSSCPQEFLKRAYGVGNAVSSKATSAKAKKIRSEWSEEVERMSGELQSALQTREVGASGCGGVINRGALEGAATHRALETSVSKSGVQIKGAERGAPTPKQWRKEEQSRL